MSKDNIINFPGGGRGNNNNNTPPPPPFFPKPEGLSQEEYLFKLIDKVTGEAYEVTRRGHLIITGVNLVLFSPEQEMLWGIPNDEYLIFFERVDNGQMEFDFDYDEEDEDRVQLSEGNPSGSE